MDEPANETSGAEDYPSLDIAYDGVKDVLAQQTDRLKSVETKANFGLASATLLTAGVTGLGKALNDATKDGAPVPLIDFWKFHVKADNAINWLTIAALVTYASIILFIFMAYRIRDFYESPDPKRLVESYISQPAWETKAMILDARAKDYTSNEVLLCLKARWANVAMVLFLVEAVLLCVIAFVQVKWL